MVTLTAHKLRFMGKTVKTPRELQAKPRAVSLFTGCGGSDLGLISAGFDVVMANDLLRCAALTYEANLPATDFRVGDIRAITEFPAADLLVGCYPCQGYSQGGVREKDRSINYLFKEFARALEQINPRAFIVENVSGLIRANFKPLFDEQVSTFAKLGYRVKTKLLNAADYGVAQDRKRIFIVGVREDLKLEYQFPVPTHGPNATLPHVDQLAALQGLPDEPVEPYYTRSFHWYYLSRDRYRGWAQQAKTILANPRHLPLHPSSPRLVKHAHNDWRFESEAVPRRYTPTEAARLQGFPPNFVFPSELTTEQRYKVVGNAVPPPLMKAVASGLASLI